METKNYYGYYEGLVVSVDAPATEPAGAVRVRIPEIHGTAVEVPDTSLPWAVPNFMFAGLQCGLIGVPPVNSVVNVIFKHGDKSYPMWIGGAFKTGEVPSDFTAAKQGLTPKGFMWFTPEGYALILNEVLKTVEIRTPSPSASKIIIDLTTKKVDVVSNSGGATEYKLTLDETAQKVSLTTPSGQKVELDEASGEAKVSASQKITLTTTSGEKLELGASEAKLTGTSKAILTAALMEIGVGATQAAILGNLFSTTWMQHGHTYIWTPGGGTGVTSGPIPGGSPPGVPLTTELSLVTKLK